MGLRIVSDRVALLHVMLHLHRLWYMVMQGGVLVTDTSALQYVLGARYICRSKPVWVAQRTGMALCTGLPCCCTAQRVTAQMLRG